MGAGIAVLPIWATSGAKADPETTVPGKTATGWTGGEKPAMEWENFINNRRDLRINSLIGYVNTGIPLQDLIEGGGADITDGTYTLEFDSSFMKFDTLSNANGSTLSVNGLTSSNAAGTDTVHLGWADLTVDINDIIVEAKGGYFQVRDYSATRTVLIEYNQITLEADTGPNIEVTPFKISVNDGTTEKVETKPEGIGFFGFGDDQTDKYRWITQDLTGESSGATLWQQNASSSYQWYQVGSWDRSTPVPSDKTIVNVVAQYQDTDDRIITCPVTLENQIVSGGFWDVYPILNSARGSGFGEPKLDGSNQYVFFKYRFLVVQSA